MSNKDIKSRNSKGERHGLWVRYYGDKLWYKCFFHNDEKVGYDEWYDWNDTGKLVEKTYYL